jgi:hypothetical protein
MRRELAEWAQQAHDLSQRRAAGLIPVDRVTLRYNITAIHRMPCACVCANWPAAGFAMAIVGSQ